MWEFQLGNIEDLKRLSKRLGARLEAVENVSILTQSVQAGGLSIPNSLAVHPMEGKTPAEAANYGAAHGALVMTTPGDTTTASPREVERVIGGGGARVDR